MFFELNYFSLTLLIGGIVGILSASIAFFRHSNLSVNRRWFFLNVVTVLWSLGYFIMITSDQFIIADYANRFLHTMAILIPSLYLQFVAALLGEEKKHSKAIKVSYYFVVIFWLLIPTKLVLVDVTPKFIFDYVSDAGPLFILYTTHFFFWVIYSEILLIKGMLHKSGLKKQQLKYVVVTTLLGFGGGSSVFLLTFNENFPPYPLILFALYPLSITYAIVRYRLMNIRLVLARSFLYFLLVATVTTVFAFTTFAISRYIHVNSRVGELMIIMVVSFLIVIGLDPLKTLLAKVTDDIFYKDKVDYPKLLQKISITIAREIDLEILLEGLKTIIKTGLKVKAADILIKDGASYVSDTPDGVKTFQDSSFFIGYLKRQHQTVIVEELYRQLSDMPEGEERSFLEGVYDEMLRNGIEFFSPVYLEGQLKAVIILGEKQSGDIYTGQDVDFFESLAPQIAVAIEKSQLYESIGEFNLKLQEKVNRATQELKETNLRLQEANAHLKQLDKAKSEFLSIASHQLRTPISAIKGYLSMLLEGDFGKVPDQQRAIIGDLFESSARLARLINIFLNVSRIESGRFKLDRTEVDVNELVQSVIKELKGQAEQKRLKLEFTPMDSPPIIYIDSDKVREVILNLIDNAIKYTPSGSITVETFVEDNLMHFKIKDTGVGIRPEEVRSLFRKFVRGTGIAQVNTTGSGLGLYIAQRVISEHGGNIWAESEGLEKGSTFRFAIPIVSKEDYERSQREKEMMEEKEKNEDKK